MGPGPLTHQIMAVNQDRSAGLGGNDEVGADPADKGLLGASNGHDHAECDEEQHLEVETGTWRATASSSGAARSR